MALEIERKFLVKGDFKELITDSKRITQGYFSSVPERSVRIRIIATRAFLTIKGVGNESGMSRYEWEREIDVSEAHELLKLCEPGIIDKTRFTIKEESGLIFEIDEFHGDNEGLIIAEIELPSEDHPFNKPDWLGDEVTGDDRYYNVMLIKQPYAQWIKDNP